MSSRIRSLVALAVLALATPAVLATNAGPAAAAPVPLDGFSDVLVASSLGQATAFAELPDERMFVTAKSGELWLLNADGTKPATPALTLTVCVNSEQGLLGVAVDPQFGSTGHLYLFYTHNPGSGCVNRVARFTLSGSTVSPASAQVLLDNIPSSAGNHNGGDVQVGKDNLLYVSVGDNANSANAQLTTNLHGKILRIGLDGSVPGSNPFAATSGAVSCATGSPGTGPCKEIISWGLRNPFRIVPDVNATGTEMFVNDVGDNTSEEIDELVVGANYGWDTREGSCVRGSRTNCDPQPPGFEAPIHDYAHSTGCSSITGGAFAPNGFWPARYTGAYLYGDFVCQKIFALVPDGNGGFTQELFVNTAGPVVHMRTVQRASGWAVYYATISGELRKITSNLPAGTTGKSMFHPITPTRVLDTRNGTGYSGRKPAAGDTITVKVTGASGVPTEAVAVALNLTGTESTSDGFITVWPSGEGRPVASSANFAAANDTVANAVIVRLGPAGQINLYTQKGAHLVADVTGYWTETATSSAGRYEPAPNPARLLDTRTGVGASTGIVGAGGSLDLQVTGRGGVPTTGISAVALVVTITDSAAAGFVTAWPTGLAKPLASTINPTGRNDIRSNLVMLPVGAGGKVSLYTLQATHLVVDVAGWFTDGTATASSSGLMIAVSPFRVIDTRNTQPFGRLGGGDTGIPDYSPVLPAGGAVAIATNLTVDATQSGGFLTAWPKDEAKPTASNVNWSGTNQTRAALTISSLASDNQVAYFPNVGTDLVVDISAYFVS